MSNLPLNKIQFLKIEEVFPNASNPRNITEDKFEKLVKSLQEFPEMTSARPLVINQDNIVIGGNMRLKAMQKAGWITVPVIKVDWSEDKQRQFIIKDNASFGEWDWEVLKTEFGSEELMEFGLDLPLDFDNGLLKVEEDDFDYPEGGVDTDIQIGDLFEIGEHRLLCGDSTQLETYEKLMNGHLADLVLTDPPYNVNYEGGTKEKLTIDNDDMSNEEFYQFLFSFYSALGQYTKAGGVWYVWHSDTEGANFRLAMANAGIMVKQCLIWVKSSMVMGRQDYQWKHEPCLYGWKEGAAHPWYNDRKQTTVLNFEKPSKNLDHPTMKPVVLFSNQIENSSKQGDIIVDAFGGSGTTMVSCHQLKRKAYVVEYNPRYCQVIINRMKSLDPTLIIKRNGVPQL